MNKIKTAKELSKTTGIKLILLLFKLKFPSFINLNDYVLIKNAISGEEEESILTSILTSIQLKNKNMLLKGNNIKHTKNNKLHDLGI